MLSAVERLTSLLKRTPLAVRRIVLLGVVVTLVSFTYMAITFEPPRYVQMEGLGRVPEKVARDFEADCGPVETCLQVAAWHDPCETRACLLGDAAGVGFEWAFIALVLWGGWRTWSRMKARE